MSWDRAAAAAAAGGAGAGAGAEPLLVTSVRAYRDRELVIFAQRWPQGHATAAAGPRSSVIAPFPSFSTRAPAGGPPLNFLQWGGCQLANSYGGRWSNASSVPGGGFEGKFGCQSGIPTVLYDRAGRALVLSPARNWMTAVHAQGNGSIGVGIAASVRTLPRDFVHETVLAGGPTVNETMHRLGDTLLQQSRKPRVDADRDFVLSHLGYWTDNGAFFDSSNNHSGFANHEQALLGVQAQWTKQGIPFRYVQWDDWQWRDASGKSIDMGGIIHWPPDASAIPSGMTDWLDMPTSQYCPMYSAHNEYISDPRYTWAVDTEAPLGGSALPLSAEFYRDLFRNGSKAQMRMFEQDFLCTYGATTNLTNGDVSTGMQWFNAMDTAALEANVTLQICMACPAHILASTELRAVTNARGTSDNDHSSQADLYPLGHSGLLSGAMGIWNSRDNVFTSAAEPNCAKGACVSPDFRLQNVAALLAGGPYGPSDGVDFLNAEEILRSCRSDGVLLRADRPLATLDAALRLGFDAPSGRGELLWGTFSQIGPLRWSYLLSVSTTQPLTVQLDEMGAAAGERFLLWDVWRDPNATSPQEVAAGAGFVVPQSPATTEKTVDTGSYQVLAPILASGWSFLEARKTVPASRRRFGDVTSTSDGFSVSVRGAARETVQVLALYKGVEATGGWGVVEVSCRGGECSGLDCDVEMRLTCAAAGCTCS